MKFHTKIGTERALCGQADSHSKTVLLFDSFFMKTDEQQCVTCLKLVARRGYDVPALRATYRRKKELYENASQHFAENKTDGKPGYNSRSATR